MKHLLPIEGRLALACLLPVTALTSCASSLGHGASRAHAHAFIDYWGPTKPSGHTRLAVKDLIDMKGVVTSAGSEYLWKHAEPAKKDAKCLAGARARGVDIVGKTNLTEFAVSVSGMNAYFGTPRNRLDHKHNYVPGGSSSGSAVAVASGRADVAFGTDTAGSIRVPAACCGILGLKTTFGLVPLDGVFPISPEHLDTVGPMARTMPRLVEGMDLLKPGFSAKYAAAVAAKPSARQIRIGRLYVEGTDPEIDKSVDAALEKSHFKVVRLSDDFRDKWMQAQKDGITVALADTWLHDKDFVGKGGVSTKTVATIILGRIEYPGNYSEALSRLRAWQRELRRAFRQVDFIALPTLKTPPARMPRLIGGSFFELDLVGRQNTQAVNFAGNPALAAPVPMTGDKPSVPVTSIQLVGPRLSEAELLNAGRLLETKRD